MKIVISNKEMLAMASYLDVFTGCVNQIKDAIDPEEVDAPVDNVQKFEDFMNNLLTNKIDKKVVVITAVPIIRNLVISVDPNFVAEFLDLYCDIVRKCTPVTIDIVKSVMKIQTVAEDITPAIVAFQNKW